MPRVLPPREDDFWDALRPAYAGLLAESSPWTLLGIAPSNLRPPTGRLEGVKIPVTRTITATNIILAVNQVGVTLTAGQNLAALFDSAGNRIALTADQSAVWTSTGERTVMPIQGGSIVIPGGSGAYLYGAVLSVGTTTVGLRGTMPAGNALNTNIGHAAAAMWTVILGNLTGQTSIPTSVTLTSNATENVPFWMGLS